MLPLLKGTLKIKPVNASREGANKTGKMGNGEKGFEKELLKYTKSRPGRDTVPALSLSPHFPLCLLPCAFHPLFLPPVQIIGSPQTPGGEEGDQGDTYALQPDPDKRNPDCALPGQFDLQKVMLQHPQIF